MTNKAKKKIWNGNVRDAALSILMEINENQAYSNLLLNRTIKKYAIDPKDRGLLTELTYGTLQHRMTLDYYLEPFVKGKLDAWVRELLRLSIYQIVYLTKIPPHAVVHEAVEIAKRRGHKGISSTVNGILRSVLRKGVRSIEDIKDDIERISIETSHPEWLIKRWVEQFGKEEALAMAHENNHPARMTARVNLLKTTVEDALKELAKEGIEATRGEVVPESIQTAIGSLANTSAYANGLLTIQDESSMLPVLALDVKPEMKVLDMCAAPGGKTTFIAEKMNNKGEVYAHDLHEHKLSLIESNANRLGIESIRLSSGDSRQLGTIYEPASFDRILVDAPCSGLGVIRRKPEIKYNKTEQDLVNLTKIQEELLDTAYGLVKEDGIIVYSTCTVEYSENAGVVHKFLEKHPDIAMVTLDSYLTNESLAIKDNMLQVLPQHFGSDGFFVAAFRKK
ncbi:16S rRNA (cytosine(967)-C(5))-methyltransferase RsmB [Sporosarcina highlanderae]|uniref:16S rRNA (cytosine(967)-C(5))-methyltransferase n=1 Tax=Sporosarcina highlanderae TaxID=3035916 RepID=A0ABT8JT05_9BACL|nr:16S rRNA (cytosine(967)-C(5))-methyltransferase RsmB [Sporosarcina highlanderae]MDN4607517.1 16S rRNA (cytosine(967)-C(5))-methyltransferase RsmB [Sporosarcina highlanderae]